MKITPPALTLQIYSTGTTPIYDVGGELLNGRDLWWETGFPAGKYVGGGVYIPRDPSKWWEVKGTLRAVLRAGQKVIYEGKIPNLQHKMSESDQGVDIAFMGLWAHDLEARNWRKRWADDRTDEATWPWETETTGVNAELAFPDRRGRLKFTPKAESWADADFVAFTYTMPYGQTVARLVYKVTLQENSPTQEWETAVYRSADKSSWTQMTNASGETYNSAQNTTVIIADQTDLSVDVEPAAGTRYLQIRYYNNSGGAQTPTSDNTYYAAYEDLMVYSEDEGAANISLESVANDMVAEWTGILNSSTAFIHTPSTERSIEPFITSGDAPEPLTSILMSAAAPGDGDDNRMSVGLLSSESVASPDGKPVMYTSEYPDVDAGYDYLIHPDDPNLVGNLNLTRDYNAELYNAIPVTYINKDGITKYLDPDETTSLKDDDSITDYGRREPPGGMRLGYQTAATAQEIGEKWLAAKKDPPWLASAITVKGYILDDNGQAVPAARIEACDYEGVGKRIKVDGYDTFIISRVRGCLEADGAVYARISVGPIDDPLYSQQIFATEFDDSVTTTPTPESDSGSGSGSVTNKSFHELTGTTWLKKSDRDRYIMIKRDVLSHRRQHGGSRKYWMRKLGYGSLMKF